MFPLLILLLAAPLAYVIVSIYMLYRPPSKINNIYGYRSKLARSSQQNWNKAQPYSARVMIFWSAVSIIRNLVLLIWLRNEWFWLAICLLDSFAIPLLSMAQTEKMLRKNQSTEL